MGFFKKFLSLGSRRRKSKQKANARRLSTDAQGRVLCAEDGRPEEDATRLLRTASARMASTDAVHSLAPPSTYHLSVPASPARSLQTLASSLKRSNTYSVKVHGRTQHSCTVFPNANPNMPPDDRHDTKTTSRRTYERDRSSPRKQAATPREESRLHALRRDPSVLSLLNMFDAHGRLDDQAFCNSPSDSAPIQEGRAQFRRSGSTLRQLLGEMEKHEDATEGDISWADRFLRETESAMSSTSSLPVETPTDADAAFLHDPSAIHTFPPAPFKDSHNPAHHPGLSSFEAEFCDAILGRDEPVVVAIPEPPPKTPQQASHVFGFLSERRKSVRSRTESAQGSTASTTSLPRLSVKSQSGPPGPNPHSRPASPSFEDSRWQTQTNISHAEVQTATLMKLSTAPAVYNRAASVLGSRSKLSVAECTASTAEYLEPSELQRATTGTSGNGNTTRKNSVAQPRGPRPLQSKQSLGTKSQTALTLDLQSQPAELPKPGARDTLTPPVPRKQRRVASRSSNTYPFDGGEDDAFARPAPPPKPAPARSARFKSKAHSHRRGGVDWADKENSPSPIQSCALGRPKGAALHAHLAADRSSSGSWSGSASGSRPSTPLRSVFDARYPGARAAGAAAPSPASSSELSPVTKEMMANLRKQRGRTQYAMRRARAAS